MAEKMQKISGCFKNSTAIALQGQQCQNKVSFQRKDSGIALKFSLHILEGRKYSLMNRHFANSSKDLTQISMWGLNPFFENLLYFDISGEQ